MLDKIRSLFDSQEVPHIRVEGKTEVTKIEYVGKIEKRTNSIANLFDLIGYEIKSDTVEIFDGKKCLGRGYVADIAGITVDITRVIPEMMPVDLPSEIPQAPSGLSIVGNAIAGALKPEWKKQDYEFVPCVILTGKERIESLRFSYLRKIEGAIIDDEQKTRYDIRDGTRIEVTTPDKKTGLGYVCDPSGQTIKIKRIIKVLAIKEGKEVEVSINFSGRIGRHATSDKLTRLLTMASGRENLIQLLLVGLVANIIGVVLHI